MILERQDVFPVATRAVFALKRNDLFRWRPNDILEMNAQLPGESAV